MERRKKLLISLGVFVLVFGAIWAATILHWRSAHRVPGGVDIALYLIALPLVVLLGIWVVIKVIKAIKRRRQAATANEAAAEDAAMEDPEDPTLAWTLPVLAGAVLFPAGDSPDALLAAASEGRRPDLHARLKDAQSQPAFAAEVEDLDTDAVVDGLPEPARVWSAGRLRTLALACATASSVLEEHFDALVPSAGETLPAQNPSTVLQLEWWLPAATWDEDARGIAAQWLTEQLAAQGWESPRLRIQTRAMPTVDAAWQRMDELNKTHNHPEARKAAPAPRLILASDSRIDDATLADWDARQHLFSARRPEGRIPGEGASALLIAASDAISPVPVARVHRLFSEKRERPVEQPQRLQSDTLEKLIEMARLHAPMAKDMELQLIGDTDGRSSRTAEALHLAGNVLPDSDPDTSLSQLGVANGDCGLPLMLGLIATAAHRCTEPEHAALMFSHHDPSLRMAMMVTPAVRETDADNTSENPDT